MTAFSCSLCGAGFDTGRGCGCDALPDKLARQDDRMALAVASVNRALSRVSLPPMTDVELGQLRHPRAWASYLGFLSLVGVPDLTEARALLAEWHVWHKGA